MIVVLVSVGVFQEYIINCIEQLKLMNYRIVVILDKKFFKRLNMFRKIELISADDFKIDFERKFENHLKNGRERKKEFYINTSKRFFYIYEYVKKVNMKNFLHIENDVLLYKNLSNFNFSKKIYLTIDNEYRCIPGIMFIPNKTLLNSFIKSFDYKEDDMVNWGTFYYNNRNLCETFPIIHKGINNRIMKKSWSFLYKNFNEFKGIFDAAAIGQSLDGTRKNNTPYANKHCIVNYFNYKIIWEKNKDGHYIPLIIIDGKKILIYSIHFCSKNLHKFKSER